jgi:hypothetical protein
MKSSSTTLLIAIITFFTLGLNSNSHANSGSDKGVHYSYTSLRLSPKQFTKGFLNKMKKPDLITYCHSKLLFVDSISKEPLDMLSKPDLVKSALYYLKNNSLVSISEKNPKLKVSGNTDLVEIGWNMKKHLDKIPDSTFLLLVALVSALFSEASVEDSPVFAILFFPI